MPVLKTLLIIFTAINYLYLFPIKVNAVNLQNTLFGTTFYYWHTNGIDYRKALFLPQGIAPLDYKPTNIKMWEKSVDDLEYANIDYIFPVTFGEYNNFSVFHDQTSIYNYLPNLVKVIKANGSNLRVGAFFHILTDTTKFTSAEQWENYWINRMTIPFFETIPQELWATHNGKLVTEGGRPVIMLWDFYDKALPPNFTVEQALQIYKSKLTEYFNTKNYLPKNIEPFVVVESTAFIYGQFTSHDGFWDWNRAIGPATTYSYKNYTISAVGAGSNESLIRPWRCHGTNPIPCDNSVTPGCNPDDNIKNYRYRNEYENKQRGPENAKISEDLANTPNNTNFVFIQDFNEMYEGSGFFSAINYPTNQNPVINWCAPKYKLSPVEISGVYEDYLSTDNKLYLNPKYYINTIRDYVNYKWNLAVKNATYSFNNYDPNIYPEKNYTITIRNDGIGDWPKNITKFGYRIYEQSSAGVSSDYVAEGRLYTFTNIFYSKNEITFTFKIPITGLTGKLSNTKSYKLKLDMVEEGVTWFEWTGDKAIQKNIQLCVQLGDTNCDELVNLTDVLNIVKGIFANSIDIKLDIDKNNIVDLRDVIKAISLIF